MIEPQRSIIQYLAPSSLPKVMGLKPRLSRRLFLSGERSYKLSKHISLCPACGIAIFFKDL